MVRIVAGEFKGRKLRVPQGRGIRPTSERARSGLFDWIGPGVQNGTVLDLYAGSGALGIEAISRGAARAIFVEKERQALKCLRENLKALELRRRCEVLAGDARAKLGELKRSGERFALILADPPYQGEEWRRLTGEIELADLLEPDGQLIVEHSARSDPGPDPAGLFHRDRKLYGETAFECYQPSA